MAHANAAALEKLQLLIRQLRAIKGLKEKSPGAFYLRSIAFAHFHDDAGALMADLKKLSGTGFDRYAVGTPAEQRTFIEEAKRRAAKLDDD